MARPKNESTLRIERGRAHSPELEKFARGIAENEKRNAPADIIVDQKARFEAELATAKPRVRVKAISRATA